MMVYSKVKSRTIRYVGYDFKKEELELTFTAGKVYVYFKVGPGEVYKLLKSKSIGAYFNRRIRDRYTCYKKIDLLH